MPVAQINIGRLRFPKGDPRGAEFFDNLDRINSLAERLPGFIWRFQDESGNATDIAFDGDQILIANLTVWESVEALQKFVFQTAHAGFYRKRTNWFVPIEPPHFAIWPIAEGHRPDYEEARGKLAELKALGPTERVFGWSETSAAQEWRAQRCA
jgi:heme-degrading monooxygenase HmoA